MSRLKTDFNDFHPELWISSPGRINLIGEHTDYNNGFVFPAAIDRSIRFGFRRNSSSSGCTVYSADYDKVLEFDLQQVERSEVEWENYILGVIHEIQSLDKKLKGFDCILRSELPIGAGLSSSAAMECGLAYGLNVLFDLNLSSTDIVKMGQRAEHNFVGTKCGIMDQYASVLGRDGHALLLDCRSITHRYVPLDLSPYALLLLNTRVSHNLASGEYNKRRADCFEGVRLLNEKAGLGLTTLRDLTSEQLQKHKELLSPRIASRCAYVLEENERVIEASKALERHDLKCFGKLLYRSHEGLRHEYEVSCAELDFLVDYSQEKEYVLGSRMMGGGFGGCTLNLVRKDHLEEYVADISKAYAVQFGLELEPIPVNPAQGTHIIEDQIL
jgi:galactokinase